MIKADCVEAGATDPLSPLQEVPGYQLTADQQLCWDEVLMDIYYPGSAAVPANTPVQYLAG